MIRAPGKDSRSNFAPSWKRDFFWVGKKLENRGWAEKSKWSIHWYGGSVAVFGEILCLELGAGSLRASCGSILPWRIHNGEQ